jgi:hypothetical protein
MARGLPETLLSDSTIYLFGRVMTDIQFVGRERPSAAAEARNAQAPAEGGDEQEPSEEDEEWADPTMVKDPYRIGDGRPLRRRHPNRLLADQLMSPDARLARIYAFSFQNEFFELVKPAIFVVNGNGVIPLRSQNDRRNEFPDDPGGPRGDEREQREYGSPLGLTGLAQIGGNLATELRVWAYDRDDYSLRLDMMTGTFDRILIEHEFAEEGLQGFVRGGASLGTPTGVSSRRRRPRGWRSDDD